jgi:carbamoyltransferase
MFILGVSCFYHESAACLLKDGNVVAASSEERFSRKKHDSDFPKKAIDFCLKKAGISASDLDFVVFYEKPFWKFQRILLSTLSSYPYAYKLFAKAMITWFSDKLWMRSVIAKEIHIDQKKFFLFRIIFRTGHLAFIHPDLKNQQY